MQPSPVPPSVVSPSAVSPSAVPPGAAPRRDLAATAPFLVAAGGGRPAHVPVWFMRQAGRSLPEYRALRTGTSMLEACLTPDLTCEITLQPVRRHGVDAAILFSDIVVPLRAAGIGVEIVAGTGPVLARPVRTAADVAALPDLDAEQVAPVTAAIGLLLAELGETPLIGFAGAPFTLASYLVEGGPSRHHERTKALMHAEPQLWDALMGRLAAITATFLRAQVAAGVDAVQLFDSWAGALSERDYRRFVLPHSRAVLAAVDGVPRIHFGVGTGELLPALAEAGCGRRWRRLAGAAGRRRAPHRNRGAGQPRPRAALRRPGRGRGGDPPHRRGGPPGARARVQPGPRGAPRHRPRRADAARRAGPRAAGMTAPATITTPVPGARPVEGDSA